MAKPKRFTLTDLDTMTCLIDEIFSEMNLGLIVYQLEDPAAASSLRLVYANKQASRYTGSDLSRSVGKYLPQAFPALAQTDVPELYAEVVRTRQPRTVGAFEYSDVNVEKAYYAVKAFPMPNACVGILFENITLRKQLEEMVKHRAEQAHPPEAPEAT